MLRIVVIVSISLLALRERNRCTSLLISALQDKMDFRMLFNAGLAESRTSAFKEMQRSMEEASC